MLVRYNAIMRVERNRPNQTIRPTIERNGTAFVPPIDDSPSVESNRRQPNRLARLLQKLEDLDREIEKNNRSDGNALLRKNPGFDLWVNSPESEQDNRPSADKIRQSAMQKYGTALSYTEKD